MDMFFWGGGFEIIFVLMFTLILGVFIVTIIRGIGEWSRNNHSPRLDVEATCTSKRTSVTHHSEPVAGDITGAHGHMTSSDTSYYATFEVESGDRIEFHITGLEYGRLREGDVGTLAFQGTRFLSFERNSRNEDVNFEVKREDDSPDNVDVVVE